MPMTVTSSIVTDGNTDFQYYDANLKAYLPDLTIIPYTFRISATKAENDVAQEVTSFVDTRVYEWIENAWSEVQSSQGLQIDLTKAQITLSKNIPVGGERLFKIEAKIADSRQPNKPVPIAQQIRVSCRSLPNDLVSLFSEYPDGRNINVTKLQDFYRLRALYRQGQNALNNVWYRWYRGQNKIETEITDANAGYLQGYNSPILQIPPYGEFDGTKPVYYKVKAYPQEDLTGINQISKSMIYDGFNEFKAGLSVKGEDADGEYYNIRQDAIYNATNNGTDDVFHGRLNYKPNQRYILSLKYKVNSGNIFFIYTYSDGTKYQQLFSSTSLTTENFITPSGKSLSKISIGYDTGGTTNIYDIQLMEYSEDGQNLLPRTSNKWETATDPAFDTNIYPSKTHTFIPIKDLGVGIGDTLTYRVEVKNSSKNVRVQIGQQDSDGNKTYTNGAYVDTTTSAKEVAYTFTINDSTVAILPMINIGTNQSCSYRGAKLERGNQATPWTPAVGEFVPAIADGLQPKPEFPDSALSTTFSLCKTYPKFNKEINVTSGGNLSVGTDMFSAECVLQSNAGTLVDPQNYYSFQWRAKPVSTGLWQDYAKGSKILMPFTEEVDIDCNVIPGLDKARYAACLDGIDDRLESVSDTFVNENKKYHLKISIPQKSGHLFTVLDASSRMIVLYSNNFLVFAIIKDSARSGKAITISPGIIDLSFDVNSGDFENVYINGSKVTLSDYNISSFLSGTGNKIILGAQYESNSTNVIYYLAQVYEGDSLLYNFDFQPTDGDRNNMRKNKNIDGTVNTVNPITLKTFNIDNINEIDPRYAFFKPV